MRSRQKALREGLILLISECYVLNETRRSKHAIFQPQKFLNKLFPYLDAKGVAFVYDIQAPVAGKIWAKFESLIKDLVFVL